MLRLTSLSNSFAHYSNDKNVQEYLNSVREDIFLTMELAKCSYTDVLLMPVSEVGKYLDWKIKFDREREKAQQEAMSNMKS